MLCLVLCQRHKTHVNYKTHKIYFTRLTLREDIFYILWCWKCVWGRIRNRCQ